jgi:hypothetical protein
MARPSKYFSQLLTIQALSPGTPGAVAVILTPGTAHEINFSRHLRFGNSLYQYGEKFISNIAFKWRIVV